jgi:hypothetical protein
MPLKIILQKTGLAGTVGLIPSTPIPAAFNDNARSTTLFQGLHLIEPIEVAFQRNAQDGALFLEAAMETAGPFVRLAFRRLDTGALIDGTTGLLLSASTTLLIVPVEQLRVAEIRAVFFLAAVDASALASIQVRYREGRS